jgi:transcriptional regulator with XRE-family HTH domain
MMEEPGQKLKRVRERLGLKFREVEEASEQIAARRGNSEFTVALSRLSDIERGMVPSLFRLYSLCAIYRLDISEVLSWYGVSPSNLASDADVIEIPRTHEIGFHPAEGEVQFPLAFDPGLDLKKTVFLSRMFQRWGKLPLMLLNNLDLKNHRYGYIGSADWSMHPLIPPTALVVIDDTKRKIEASGWNSEHDRPIYFLEHARGYLCGWCTLQDGVLTVQYHPASGYSPETFAYPGEIEVIGQVTLVAMKLSSARRRS